MRVDASGVDLVGVDIVEVDLMAPNQINIIADVDHWKLRFAVPRKSTRLYLSLTLVACDKVRLVDSTVFTCSSVVCPAFVALL